MHSSEISNNKKISSPITRTESQVENHWTKSNAKNFLRAPSYKYESLNIIDTKMQCNCYLLFSCLCIRRDRRSLSFRVHALRCFVKHLSNHWRWHWPYCHGNFIAAAFRKRFWLVPIINSVMGCVKRLRTQKTCVEKWEIRGNNTDE